MDKGFFKVLQDKTVDFIYDFGPRLIYALIALIIGVIIIKLTQKLIGRLMLRTKTDPSLRSFLRSIGTVILWSILIFIIGLILGVKASAFFTVFGAAGIAIGLALQGSLSNFAGGLLILIFKPFRVGDEVIINGVQGYVEDINILYTKVNNWRGEVFTMPNGQVSNNMVRNNSAKKYRRVQIELHFEHKADVDKLREIIISTMKKHPKTIATQPYQFWVNSFQDYYIKTSARCWCNTEDYWEVYWAQEEAIKKALEAEGVELAIPKQIEIHED